MKSCLEALSTEIIFEIFDYLNPWHILYGFIGINRYFDQIVRSYPLKLDFQQISRSKFDFICQNIQPKQVYHLLLSEKFMPDQIRLLLNHFPRFQKEFLNLRSVNFLFMKTFRLDLPDNTSSLTFKQNFPKENSDSITKEVIYHQANCLTYLDVDSVNAIPVNNIYFNVLTHLIINDDCLFSQFEQISCCIQISSLIHLKVSIYDEDMPFLPKLKLVCQNLISLSHLDISLRTTLSFDLLEECLIKLVKLKYLTIQAWGHPDLIDGTRWEEFLRRTRIEQFNFQLSLYTSSPLSQQEQLAALERFRSSFWLEEKHWYVACEHVPYEKQFRIYSLPYFLPNQINESQEKYVYPPLSTVPINLHNQFFFQTTIDSYTYIPEERRTLPMYRFTKIQLLEIWWRRYTHVTYQEFINTLTSSIDLNQIKTLDFAYIVGPGISYLQLLLAHTPQLNHLITNVFDTSLILPEHIYSLTLRKVKPAFYEESFYPIDVENVGEFSRMLMHVQNLTVPVDTEEIMIQIIDKFQHLQTVTFQCGHSLLSNISSEWFQTNTHRLSQRHSNTYTTTQRLKMNDPAPTESQSFTFRSNNRQKFTSDDDDQFSLINPTLNNIQFTCQIRSNTDLDRKKTRIDLHEGNYVKRPVYIHYDRRPKSEICLSMIDQ
ncbi:unnamed protein product [Adineta ricciae]|uniref:F-box domain-containing protein n=2 Tax=Adineta ricciae TaxID=249248 RepID=A0A815DNX5_ADIRI|nr:unnamed protein product [Adineta ricciae]